MAENHSGRDKSLGMKWLLLISSLVVLAVLAAEIKSGFSADWRRHQKEYRSILMAKATNDAGRESAKAFDVALQQVVVPELGATDRCVSCHTGLDDPRMADEKQPYRTHPGSILKDHPIDKFGCVVCHRGQGRATHPEDAMGAHSHWDYPMLPGKMVQASCGQCHDPKTLDGRGGEVLARGAKLFESAGCRSCHTLGGRGGALGIALDDEGRRIIHQLTLANIKGEHTVWNWLAEHFRDPQGVVPGSQMKNPALTGPEIEALTTFMLSLSKATLPNDYIAQDKIAQKYQAAGSHQLDGATLYKQYCFACHESGTHTRWDKNFKRFIPAVRGPAMATSPSGYLRKSIEMGREGTQMPGWRKQSGGLSDAEISALESHIRAGSEPTEPAVSLNSKGVSGRGRVLFDHNCRGCHGAEGKGGIAPVLASASFQEAASDAFIVSTIKAGRPDTAMPAFQQPGKAGLDDAELADLLAYIRSLE